MSESRAHVPALDGLRAVAILLVLGTHLPRELTTTRSWLPHVLGAGGYLGVDLFFVLSGFLITRILLADRSNGVPLRFFLARRFLRIFPIYYLVIVIALVLAPGWELLWCATYTSNYYFAFVRDAHPLRHTWSLAVEEHFYLIWPLVVHSLTRQASRKALLGIILPTSILSSILIVVLELPAASHLVYHGTLSRAWSLGLGALTAYYEPELRERLRLNVFTGGAMLLGALALLSISVLSGRTRLAPVVNLLAYSGVSWILLLAALAAATQPVANRIATSRPLLEIGRISYGLYLYHAPIYAFVFDQARRFEPGSSRALAIAVPVAVLLSFVTAAVSYRVIEAPLLRLKARFQKRPSTEVLGPDPVTSGQ
jgi:peptidoglycan/LPS O-acetylase OafA/YrhL